MDRLDKKIAKQKREEYYEDPLYVSLTDAIDEFETKIGGLTPEEVWGEVIRIKDLLLSTKRPDKEIQNIRTEIEEDYQTFKKEGNIVEPRHPMAGEWSSIVVLTCVMHFLLTVDPLPELNYNLALKIRKLIWDHPAYPLIRRRQKPAEKAEEDAGNPVPNEDRLRPLIAKTENPELVALRNKLMPVILFFAVTLEQNGAVKNEYLIKTDEGNKHQNIWKSFLYNELLLRELAIDTLNRRGFKENANINYQKAVETKYNLKLILNIIGAMKVEGIIDMSNEDLSHLFFTSLRVSYLSDKKLALYEEKSSALTQDLHDIIIAIIRKFK